MKPVIKRTRVVGIIIRDGRILLIHRFKDGDEYYVFPGGGVEEGESNEAALMREMREELSIEAEGSSKLFEIKNEGRKEIYYTIMGFTGTPQIGGPERKRMDESNQYRILWLPLTDIGKIRDLRPQEAAERLTEFL
jgi:ADP-ribose pyrophosphatase YjhB (NUDIX family)